MADQFPDIPAGSGQYPILAVAISANRLIESSAFYQLLFGWSAREVSATLTAAVPPGGPPVMLRAGEPDSFQAMIPFIGVTDVRAELARIMGAGGTVEKEPWDLPTAGTLARFRDPSGTIYGLTNGYQGRSIPRIEFPMRDKPRPAAGSVCAIEMYAAEGIGSPGFFESLFGWSTLATMPSYVSFDPGGGVGGTFQSHTPATPALAYLYADDVSHVLDRIEGAGGGRLGEAMAVPDFATFGYFRDPSGTAMGLIGHA